MKDLRIIGERYELCGELAAGGMAIVHLARQRGAGGFARIVAVKRLHERYARDPEFVAMFLDEARLVARIRHTNVVQTLDVVAERNADGGAELFIVLEYVHGESLHRLLALTRAKDEPVPLKIASAIVTGMLQGLHEAHEAQSESGQPLGIVHRDVSPHNVLVGIDGVARVLDFGVAKASERLSSTQEGSVKGKLSYMAPEQLSAEDVDRRADIYSAGVVLWEMLAGQKLFAGGNEGALVRAILDAAIAPPSLRNGNVTDALDSAIMRGLAKERDQRFATALDFANAVALAIPPATAAEVGAWVRAIAKAELEEKTRIIASIEAKTSSKNAREAVASLALAADQPPSASMKKTLAIVPPDSRKTQPTPPQLAQTSLAPPPSVGNLKIPANRTMPLPPGFVPPSIAPPETTGTRANAALSTRAPPKRLSKVVIAGALGSSLLLLGGGIALIRYRPKPPSVVTAPPLVSAPPPALSCPAEMVQVAAGSFFMGSDERLVDKPAHKVTLHAFCIDKLEVATADYKRCSDRGSCLRAGRTNQWPDITEKEKTWFDPLCNIADDTRAKHPVNCVDWSMANRYCEETGKRLPTEAEWEYAARGSDGRSFPWGDGPPTPRRLNACGAECVRWQKKVGAPTMGTLYPEDDGWPNTAPVGSFPDGKSSWGAEDMVGNVSEWVADFMNPYAPDDVTDPKGPEAGKERVIRGGAWTGPKTDYLHPSYRWATLPSNRNYAIGFRCAKVL